MLTRDHLIYFLSMEDLYTYSWYREMFGMPIKEEYEYITYDVKTKIVKFKNIELSIQLSDDRPSPLLLSDVISLKSGDMDNIFMDVTTTVCSVIQNCILLVYPFGKKVPFIELPNPIDIENTFIVNELGRTIDTSEYDRFVESCDLLEQLATLFVISSSQKIISPAPGIMEYKKKIYAEYREKYGDRLDTDITLVAEIDELLVAYDINYLKDDPSYGILLTDKVIKNARKNMYGSIGAEVGLDGEVTPIIENSLLEGYPNDNASLASIYNSSRQGSIGRGLLTQGTGADAKVSSRVTNNIVTTNGDCKTTDGLDVLLLSDNLDEYVGYTAVINGISILLTSDNIKDYINKHVIIRSYMKCKEKNNKYCGVCSGELGKDNNHIAIILTTENSSIFTNTSMKSMHDKSLALVKYDFNLAIS